MVVDVGGYGWGEIRNVEGVIRFFEVPGLFVKTNCGPGGGRREGSAGQPIVMLWMHIVSRCRGISWHVITGTKDFRMCDAIASERGRDVCMRRSGNYKCAIAETGS